MKKINHLILVILIFTGKQSYCQQWLLLGNSGTNPATDFVGTTDSNPLILKTTFTITPQPIQFYTSNSLRMTLNSNGLLGIGNGPNFRLDVKDCNHPQKSDSLKVGEKA